jgi:hypothetical protein
MTIRTLIEAQRYRFNLLPVPSLKYSWNDHTENKASSEYILIS